MKKLRAECVRIFGRVRRVVDVINEKAGDRVFLYWFARGDRVEDKIIMGRIEILGRRAL